MKHPKTVLLAMIAISMVFGSTAVHAADITSENISADISDTSDAALQGTEADGYIQTSDTDACLQTMDTDEDQKLITDDTADTDENQQLVTDDTADMAGDQPETLISDNGSESASGNESDPETETTDASIDSSEGQSSDTAIDNSEGQSSDTSVDDADDESYTVLPADADNAPVDESTDASVDDADDESYTVLPADADDAAVDESSDASIADADDESYTVLPADADNAATDESSDASVDASQVESSDASVDSSEQESVDGSDDEIYAELPAGSVYDSEENSAVISLASSESEITGNSAVISLASSEAEITGNSVADSDTVETKVVTKTMAVGHSYTIKLSGIYTFTPDQTGYYEFRSSGSNDPYIRLLSHEGSQLGYSDNMSDSSNHFDLIIHLEKGRTYTLDMGINGSSDATFKCIVKRQNTSPYNGIFKGIDGNQYYTENHQINYNYSGLVQDDNGSWYVKKGKLKSDYTGLLKKQNTITASNNGPSAIKAGTSWTYVSDGQENADYTGLAQYGSTWYYVENAQPDTSYTGLVSYDSSLWYVKKGKRVLTYTGAVRSGNAKWYVKNGKVEENYNGGLTLGSKVYRVINGKISDTDIRTQVRKTYLAICRMSGRRPYNDEFGGMCGAYSAWTLLHLGITTKYQGFNGNQTFETFKDLKKSSGGYRITAYSGEDYTLKSALLAATENGTKDIFNVLVGFDKGSISSAGQTWGHTFFIHAVIDGVVYYSESFTSYSLGINEGEVMACTIDELSYRYTETTAYARSKFDGIIHFQE